MGDETMIARRFPILDRNGRAVAEIIVTDGNGTFTLERTTFINSFKTEVAHADADRLRAAAEREDWATIDAFDPEMLPWYCRSCACNYASDEWSVWARFDDDEGFHWLDSYRGLCPNGHQRMIAD